MMQAPILIMIPLYTHITNKHIQPYIHVHIQHTPKNTTPKHLNTYI